MTTKSMSIDIMARNSKEVEEIVRSQLSDVKQLGLVNPTIDPRERFHLDTTKIAYHKERVEAWLRGERVAPITIDMITTIRALDIVAEVSVSRLSLSGVWSK